MALAKLQRGGREGANCRVLMRFNCVFTFSMHLVLWLFFFLLGGADFLRTWALGRLLGRQEGSMRVPDGPGEAPEGMLAGRKSDDISVDL